MASWKDRLDKKKILIADGGWGTELIKLGLGPGEVPETWNLEQPEKVRQVAASYVEAGADIILTNTFGGSPIKLAKLGLEEKADRVNRSGAEISRKAAGEQSLVFASMGPTGEFLEPYGTATEAKMARCFGDQVKALSSAGIDGIVIETMTDLAETKIALTAVKRCSSLPVAVSMTFDKKRTGYATIMGVRLEQAAGELEKAGADLVGANCGAGIDQMIDVVRTMRQVTSLPIWCKPNAGLPKLVNGKTIYQETPEQMASQLKWIIEAGGSIVGGCCGTTPAHIRALVVERNRLMSV